jgi:hypothetical protein
MAPTPEEPIDIQRVLMDRARRMAERDLVREKRPLLPRLVALGLAVLVVVTVLFAFDSFLASMQRFIRLPVTDPEPSVTEPLPAYAVPEEAPAVDAGSSAPDATARPPAAPND